MDENDLKRYTVILGGGSGVLFQPLDETKTYILSARHVFYNEVENDRGQKTNILTEKISFYFSYAQNDKKEIEVKKGENYFEHAAADAAILVLEENLGFDQIFIDERTIGFDSFSLTGYPEGKRKANDQYDRQVIKSLISSDENLISLRLVVDHLDHNQITGFSGGGILKPNGDSLLLAGIQSKTPIGDCNGEIQVVPIKRFEEIVDANSNLSKLIPNYFSKIDLLVNTIIEFNQSNPLVINKFKAAFKIQSKQIKCELKDFYKNSIISKSSILNSSLKSKAFWMSFIEYALIISLLEDQEFNEELFSKISKSRKFIFSDSNENIYNIYRDVAYFASENIDEQCQILLATTGSATTERTRRMPLEKVPKSIFNVDDKESIDRVTTRKKIKEIIHIKAIEYDCLNNNEENFNAFEEDQFDEILTEIKKLINEFFNN